MAQRNYLIVFIALFIPSISLNAATITINTTSQRAAISPYIYGINQPLSGGENTTVMRLGGNRMTGYNWETNASNAGSDWYMSSDNYMCGSLSAAQCSVAGAVLKAFVDGNLANGMQSLITVPMAGYVSADENGSVTEPEKAPSSRWDQVIPIKGTALVYPPDTSDTYVYVDEEIAYLVNTYGNSTTQNGVKFYDLDNEPGIWGPAVPTVTATPTGPQPTPTENRTHPRLHPAPVYCTEYVQKSIDTGMAIKNVDPNAMTFGGVFYGWSDYESLNGALDWTTEGAGYNWFVEYYLKKMKDAEAGYGGKRILDVIDFHYYSEATGGGCRVIDSGCSGYPTVNQAERMNATRTLWETGYRENSWIGQWYPQWAPLIPLITQAINTYYTGTKIAFTEWNFGGGKHFSGGLADVDMLGIFGKYGIYLATMWSVDEGAYSSAAFKMYRNYDGSKSTFGDTHVQADSDTSTMSVYASIFGSDDSTLHIILVNKYNTAQTANVTITSPQNYTTMQVYGFDSTSSTITVRSAVAITGNAFTYNMPMYSACHFILKSNVTPTQTVNWTASPTFTITPVYSPTMTPTISTGGRVEIKDVLVYPNPLINGPDTLYLRLDTTFTPASAEMKIYTGSFRLINVVTWGAADITGHYDIKVPLEKTGNLANGMYFYVLTLKDAAGKEARSRASEFIVIR
jgi:hypothetical protein